MKSKSAASKSLTWKFRLSNFVTAHRWEVAILILIIAVAAVCRFYRIHEYMVFLGDEGRDARVVAKMITELDVVLIGPMTSVTTSSGHMYLGPAYYYLMAPFMFLFNLSPVGASVMVALFSLATVYLLWWAGRQWFHPAAGLVAASLYAISPIAIIYSRSSWNPNIMPFFSLLAVWSIYQVWHHKRYWWLTVTGFSTAMVLQSHYLGLLLVPTIGFFALLTGWQVFQSSKKSSADQLSKPQFIKWTAIGVGILALMMSPLLVFDIRHDWLNFNAFKAFFTERQTTVNLKFYKGFENMWPILNSIYTRLLGYEMPQLPLVTFAFTVLGIAILFIKNKFKTLTPGLLILIVWLLIGLLGLSIYKQHIYDHYFGFLYPIPFLLTGWLFSQLWTAKSPISVFNCCFPLSKIWGVLLLLGLMITNLTQNPLQYGPNFQLQRTREVSHMIIEKSQGQPFNLGMIAKSNYDEGYRFFLERFNASLVAIDAQHPETITDQLFVICEDEECNPVGHRQAEIAHFGWSQVDETWELPWGHTLFKLTHVPPEETVSEEENQ